MNQTTITPQQVAETYLKSTKQNSSLFGGTQSGSSSGSQSSDRHRTFQVWLDGFRSCLQHTTQSSQQSSPNLNETEIYSIVEKQQKSAAA